MERSASTSKLKLLKIGQIEYRENTVEQENPKMTFVLMLLLLRYIFSLFSLFPAYFIIFQLLVNTNHNADETLLMTNKPDSRFFSNAY